MTFLRSPKTDLGKQDGDAVRHRVVCDWLRNLDKRLARIERQMNILVESQLSSPLGEPMEDDDSSNTRSVQ